MRPKVSILLPTYNEVGNAARLCAELASALNEYPLEIIVVDDNSTDGTIASLQEAAVTNPTIKLYVRTEEFGLTSAVNRAIEESGGDILVRTDADFSLPVATIVSMVKSVESGQELVFSSRYVEGGRDLRDLPLHKFLSLAINLFAQLILTSKFKDYTSNFFACKRLVLEQVGLQGDYGEYFIYLLFKAYKQGFKISEIPYSCMPRTSGESKTATSFWGFMRRGWPYVTMIIKLRFNRI